MGPGGAGGSTKNFLRGLIGALPPIHELAEQAGIDLPEVRGKVRTDPEGDPGSPGKTSRTPELT